MTTFLFGGVILFKRLTSMPTFTVRWISRQQFGASTQESASCQQLTTPPFNIPTQLRRADCLENAVVRINTGIDVVRWDFYFF